MIAFRYWLRNLFTDQDGEFSDARWRTFALIAGVAVFVTLMIVTRNMPATSHSDVTVVVVNDPSGAPVTVVVQP